MAHVTLIGPGIVTQKGDFFGTGIPYFPLTVLYAAAHLRSLGHNINLIDAFGENPFQVAEEGDKYIQGLTPQQVASRISPESILICIGAERLIAHGSVLALLAAIRQVPTLSRIPVAILENTQAVTAYSLRAVKEEFLSRGAQFIVTGEPEIRLVSLIGALAAKDTAGLEERLARIDGLIFRGKDGRTHVSDGKEFIRDPDVLPFPAWDLTRVENYWKLGYAHAPITTGKYLPLLTSRGCPYPCTFCVVPNTNNQRWRPRSAKNVVDEMEFFFKSYGVREYHLEDLNPTIRKDRMQEIAMEIMKRDLPIEWKIVSGTKVETLDEETIRLMAKSGCTYVSISPETGSPRIIKMMRKPMPYVRALELVREMHRSGMTTQACFILGYPGEQQDDLRMTRSYIRQIVRAGIDEIAVLILTPTPGSEIFEQYARENELTDITRFTFTPIWRRDYRRYALERVRCYLTFLFWRAVYHPLDLLRLPIDFLLGTFRTKSEMTLYRLLRVWVLSLGNKVTINGQS